MTKSSERHIRIQKSQQYITYAIMKETINNSVKKCENVRNFIYEKDLYMEENVNLKKEIYFRYCRGTSRGTFKV